MTPLPQLSAAAFLTDAGLETSLIYDDGLDLPDFAAFTLIETPQGRSTLTAYYQRYVRIAARHDLGVVLDTATWRASRDWLVRQGFADDDVTRINRAAVELLSDLRVSTPRSSIVVSGCVGPRHDGYAPQRSISASEAQAYHAQQVIALADAGADVVSALTMTSADEAIGIASACRQVGVPAVVSFTVETDGRLPDGTTLDRAINLVDEATDGYPAYFMVNCAHPEHFSAVIGVGGDGLQRIRGVRCNASRLSHAELDDADELDAGDPHELAALYVSLHEAHPQITIWGGCCGTNHQHVAAFADALAELRPDSPGTARLSR